MQRQRTIWSVTTRFSRMSSTSWRQERGYKQVIQRTALETSYFLKNDCLKIYCTLGIVVSTIDYSRPHSIQVPNFNITYRHATLYPCPNRGQVNNVICLRTTLANCISTLFLDTIFP
ncbi:hypothetical protein QYE76_034209 [Lolium multiflorum]|uniref:Uncharacterized protein n=1 Tax=Lolium multiflorum TaxID=4521 RepID=A0AAD8VMB1_LOLMU|nr:hypothetical protein QYE76_034209 [Lolium multiflorum]